MILRSLCLGLLATAVSASALAQQQQQNGGQNPYGTQQNNGQQPYGTQQQNGQPLPYGAQPPVRPYAPPQTALPAPMNQPQDQRRYNNGLPIDPPGYGWCRYTDDADKRTFYSAPFPGSPKRDLTPRAAAFTDYIHRAYPGFQGVVDCFWQPYDNAYGSQVIEDHNESYDQLRNFNMINTHWKPAGA